jgi:hypothetical protein
MILAQDHDMSSPREHEGWPGSEIFLGQPVASRVAIFTQVANWFLDTATML